MDVQIVIGNTFARCELGSKGQLVNPDYLETVLNRLTDAAIRAWATKKALDAELTRTND